MNQTRNILQTAQSREITKTAPDILVTLDGLPYLVNPFLTSEAGPYTIVNFNDHVVSYQGNYDVDSLIPTATIVLSVPNHQKFLYQSPGGNNVLSTMMHVQVFSKGFYLSNKGNSLYRKVLKGVVTNISYADTGKNVQITLTCASALHLLELMYIELSPAAITNSPNLPVAYQSIQANLGPLEAIANTFLLGLCSVNPDGTRSYNFGEFLNTQVGQQKITDSPYKQSIINGYITKWQPVLESIQKDVRIFGADWAQQVANGKVKADSILAASSIKAPDPTKDSRDIALAAAQNTIASTQSHSEQSQHVLFEEIRKYLPDMGIAPIQLLNGKRVSRVARIRQLINAIGFEGYTDLDGTIIVKPPLYNLDVTNIGIPSSGGATLPPSMDIYDKNNPFIVNLDDILTESETEDESQIRSTRMTIVGSWDPRLQFGGNEDLLNVGEFIDVALMAKFGVRDEGRKHCGWAKNSDNVALFAYAANEMARGNRGFRTYTFSIQQRPELRLGFPVYLPHRDMYGYIKAISISYQQGSTATMTVHLDTLRKRPMFPERYEVTNSDGSKTSETIYSTQMNLVLRWTQVPDDTGSQTISQGQAASRSSAPYTVSKDAEVPSADKKGQPQTLPSPRDLSTDDKLLEQYRSQKLGAQRMMEANDPHSRMWRIQEDVEHKFTQQVPCDSTYMQTVRYCLPYTDEKGYELITPFPWGRWRTLKESLQDFIYPTSSATFATQLTGVQTFLFGGIGQPKNFFDSAGNLSDALAKLQTAIDNNTVFELTYDATGGGDSLLTTDPTVSAGTVSGILQSDPASRAATYVNPMAAVVSSNIKTALLGNEAKLSAAERAALSPTNTPPPPSTK